MKLFRTALFAGFGLSIVLVPACGSLFDDDDNADPHGTSSSGGFGGDNGHKDGDAKACTGLCLRQVACATGTTSLSGTVKDPAGKVPLYNVLVYVPNAPVAPLPSGANCDRCGSISGDPLVTALTGVDGKFKLDNVPVGADIPLVVQIGKFRRQLVVPNVAECEDTPLADDDIRLPRKQSEGDLPQIALTTGGADVMECWLRKIGIDDSEFTTSNGSGKVHFFKGSGGGQSTTVTSKFDGAHNGGASFEDAQTLWSTQASLMKYDMVILSCEGDTYPNKKPPEALGAMKAYADAGGRIFASHFHRYWFDTAKGTGVAGSPAGPEPSPFEPMATWRDRDAPCGSQSGCKAPGTIVTSFPKGQAMKQWLGQSTVDALDADGTLPIEDPRHNVDAADEDKTTTWITVPNNSAPSKRSIEYLSFNTPIPAPEDQKCGRVVYNDLHVTTQDSHGPAWPTGCNTEDLTPQEKALEFMLFDLSSCIQSDKEPPAPPPPVN